MPTNNAFNIGTGAAGTIVQGAGAGVALTFSTPTYPSASGTAGKILRSDGTNNVYSTATYPDTAGSSTNVLTSDGTNWVSSAAPTGNLLSASITLTSAQVKSLHATPIQIVAAPGSGKGIVPVQGIAKLIYGGTNAFTAGALQVINLFYNNGTTSAFQNLITNAMITATATVFASGGRVASPGLLNVAAGVLDNVNLVAYNASATEISGNAANNNSIDITIYYFLITF